MARPAFVVNEALRETVRHLAGLGVPQEDIAKIVGCSPKTLRKRFRDELDRGVAEANAVIAGCLFAAAKAGNIGQ
jgi:DNA-binding Lrp family transcriptional regulator